MEIKELLKDIKAYIIPDELYIKMMYKKHTGETLDLNRPLSLNQKLQWLKLNDRRAILTQCADKYAVRDYVSKKIGAEYLIPLLKVYDSHKEIRLNDLPEEPFIIKANHTSGTFKIVRDKKSLDEFLLQNTCKSWLKKNYYSKTKEWQYKNIKPLIIVEKLLCDNEGNIPNDIKFSCINGRVEIIHVDSNKEVEHLRNNYSRDWQPLDFSWPKQYKKNIDIRKPDNLEKLIQLAEKLAEEFDFVRIDFYNVNGSIYFGEITFHPTSGYGQFEPMKYDMYYGNLLKLKTY